MSFSALKQSQTIASMEPSKKHVLDEHALIGISTFNSYFSVENMEKLFLWARENFTTFDVFFMDEASVFNLMAIGYDEKKALEKTKKHDRNLRNRIVKSFTNIGFDLQASEKKILLLSDVSKTDAYREVYEKCLSFFEKNLSFKEDCLEITRRMLLSKLQEVDEGNIKFAVNYLLAELPLWYDTPYVLNLSSSTLVYKDLSFFWQKICYDYKLLSPQQKILIKSIVE